MSGVTDSVSNIIKKSRGNVKFVLFRLPKNTAVSDLDGLEIDLSDLKVTSDKGFRAVSDRATIPERGSACPLLPDGDVLKCGDAFVAHVQLIKEELPPAPKKKRTSSGKDTTAVTKPESVKKSKKAVKEQNSD